jgi:hypothetical protein
MDQKIRNLILIADDDKDDCILTGHSVGGHLRKPHVIEKLGLVRQELDRT